MEQSTVKVYGTTWCPDCWRAKKILDTQHVTYQWVNIDEDAEAAEYVKQLNGGMRSVPTLVFMDGTVLVEPSNATLLQALSSRQKL
jgi:mycoredoxin